MSVRLLPAQGRVLSRAPTHSLRALLLALDDIDWKEGDHPRGQPGNAGQFGAGHAASKSLPDPTTHGPMAVKKAALALAKKRLIAGDDPHDIARELKTFANQHEHPAVSNYVNKMLAVIASAHDIDPAAFGQAKPKGKSIIPPTGVKPNPPEPKPEPKPEPQSSGKSLTLAEAISGKHFASEREYHRSSFAHADPVLLAAIKNVTPLGRVTISGGGASYSASHHEIKIYANAENERNQGVWRHEFGHAMDADNRGRMLGGGERHTVFRSFAADPDRQTEAADLLDKIKGTSGNLFSEETDAAADLRYAAKVGNNVVPGISARELLDYAEGDGVRAVRIAKVLQGNFTYIDLGYVARSRPGHNIQSGDEILLYEDFLGAMTHNAIGGGHSNDYYASFPYRHCSEMFANYVSLTAGSGGKVYRAALHAIAPKCCAHFDTMIRDLANNKKDTA